MSALVLGGSPSDTSSPVIKPPTAAAIFNSNRYYDSNWYPKQEYALTVYLNYILTPDEFKTSKANTDSKFIA